MLLRFGIFRGEAGRSKLLPRSFTYSKFIQIDFRKWYNRHMNKQKTNTTDRAKSVAAAVGSVRAEGLTPSAATIQRLKRYAEGKITAQQLRRETINEVRSRNK